MLQLSREIRLALASPDEVSDRVAANSWAGWPASLRIVPQVVLRCVIAGTPNPRTGYLCDIKIIDDLLRHCAIKVLLTDAAPIHESPLPPDAGIGLLKISGMLHQRWEASQGSVGKLQSLTLAVSPWLNYRFNFESPDMVQLTQQFEFSAAHRLHCAHLSDEENRAMFGKCNNPNGHGHNYVVEVTVANSVDAEQGGGLKSVGKFSLAQFEAIVKRTVIDRLDHKHLNQDVDYFADVNPSVENISMAIYGWLTDAIDNAQLVKVRVYETPKTWAEFSG